jgi:hypothetical protein
MSFRTDQPMLKDVLDNIASGDTQLPDFQRGWVWDDEHIRSLIASISLGYPVGAVMFLEAGGVPFKPRLFEGVQLSPAPAPRMLVLDGQQRLTSLYMALRSGGPVRTRTEKGKDIERVYFLDMAACLDPAADREDAVISVPADLRVTSDFGRAVELDLSTQDVQFARRLFPLSLMYDTVGFMRWKMDFARHHANSAEAAQFLMNFEHQVWLTFQQYRIPAIELLRGTARAAVCQVFEKVNTGGVTLTVFELVTATFAVDSYDLRDDWQAREKRLRDKRAVLRAVAPSDFLAAVTLLHSYERSRVHGSAVSCKRADVLRLELTDYLRLAPAIERGFLAGAKLLAELCVYDVATLPYATQLIPLSAIVAALGNRIEEQPVRARIRQWYWAGVFGELYGAANETRYALDLPQVLAWIEGDEEPRTIRDSGFTPTRLLSLQTRLSAAYKGLSALLMREGSHDWLSGTPMDLHSYFDGAVDIHHVFPRAWCENAKLPREKWNSVINKTMLAAGTNRYLGGSAPSQYLDKIERNKKRTRADLDRSLATHALDPALLRADAFDAFIRDRAGRLLALIEMATGKKVAGKDSEETIREFGAALI